MGVLADSRGIPTGSASGGYELGETGKVHIRAEIHAPSVMVCSSVAHSHHIGQDMAGYKNY